MPWAELTDCRCYYELHGSGEPLLLVSGLGATCRSWDPILEDLRQIFCLIPVDNRGMGQSIAKRPPHSLREYGADLIELMDTLQIERAHVLGLSLGGVVAHRLAADHPSRVNRLVLISCTHRFTPYLREIAKLIGHTLRRFPAQLYLHTVEVLGSSPRYIDLQAHRIEEKIRQQLACGLSRNSLAQQLRCLAAADEDPVTTPISAPTLVIAGQCDGLIPPCYAQQTAEAIPGSRFVLLPDTGHNPVTECPQLVAQLVTGFLKEGALAWTTGFPVTIGRPTSVPSDRASVQLCGDLRGTLHLREEKSHDLVEQISA